MISINGPGLVVAGALMLTSLIIIPLFFMKKPIYEGFGYGRTGKKLKFFTNENDMKNDVPTIIELMGNKVTKTDYELG